MDKKPETMSNWNCVTQLLENEKPIELSHPTSRRMLSYLSYYKFAVKMIGTNKRVLDVGCGEGLGTWVLAKECGYCHGIDTNIQAIELAQNNFRDPSIEFSHHDFFKKSAETYDAIVSLQIDPVFIERCVTHLSETGIAVIGHAKKEKEQEILHAELSSFFEHVFLFAANDELIHTGNLVFAEYTLALCCKPKKQLDK